MSIEILLDNEFIFHLHGRTVREEPVIVYTRSLDRIIWTTHTPAAIRRTWSPFRQRSDLSGNIAAIRSTVVLFRRHRNTGVFSVFSNVGQNKEKTRRLSDANANREVRSGDGTHYLTPTYANTTYELFLFTTSFTTDSATHTHTSVWYRDLSWWWEGARQYTTATANSTQQPAAQEPLRRRVTGDTRTAVRRCQDTYLHTTLQQLHHRRDILITCVTTLALGFRVSLHEILVYVYRRPILYQHTHTHVEILSASIPFEYIH